MRLPLRPAGVNRSGHTAVPPLPSYPAEAIGDMVGLSRLGADSRALEIGCGTSKATVPLAELGIRIDAVELGDALASVAEGNCRRWPSVRIVRGAFESLPLPRAAYDLVFSAQAFHWIDKDVRFMRSWELFHAQRGG